MAKELKKVNVVTVGVGFTGGIALAECAKAGLSVVGLERGDRRAVEDFQDIHDEWRYAVNYGLMQDLSKETITFRNTEEMRALPMRKLGSFLLGDGLGGAGVHWNGMNFRFSPYDFQIKTMTDERYGKNKLGKEYILQDYPLTYDEMEPYYTAFEMALGVAGEPDYLNEHHVTFVFWVPFVLVNVANFNIFESKKPEYLKDVFIAGEVMPNKHLNYWRKHLPSCRYVNLYGPTEITVDCTYYIVEREFADSDPLPIGFPCRNSDVLILNDEKKECAINEEGELCVRGSSLALGYYNNSERTASAFIQNPLNSAYPEIIYCTGDIVYKNEQGEIMYVGRKDFQIKHSGYRIELGEIENAVLGTHMVDSCCVVYDFKNKQIVLFYQSHEDLNLGEFRKSILKFIPRYMMPTVNNRVESMEINANGKIDRKYYTALLNG